MSIAMDLKNHGELALNEEPERYNEKCGVFGCYNVMKASHTVGRLPVTCDPHAVVFACRSTKGADMHTSSQCYYGMVGLQHRGQEGGGMVTLSKPPMDPGICEHQGGQDPQVPGACIRMRLGLWKDTRRKAPPRIHAACRVAPRAALHHAASAMYRCSGAMACLFSLTHTHRALHATAMGTDRGNPTGVWGAL